MWIWTRLRLVFASSSIRRRTAFCGRRTDQVEVLESRIVPTAVTGYEQYFLELMNRARQDPVAEAARFGIDLNEGLAAGTLLPGARQPLALNDALQAAIEGHLADELAHNYFGHNGSDGSTFDSRINAAGYANWTTIGENLALQYTTGSVNVEQFINDEYKNLFVDSTEAGRGHRVNIVNGNFKEVGSAVQTGTYQGNNAVDTGNDFGARPGNSFLTGVIYTDTVNANNFYNVGEGLGGISVDVTGTGGATFHMTANAAGGYQMALPPGSYSVRFSGTGMPLPIDKSFTIGSQNIEVDANTRVDVGTSGPPVLSGTNPILYVAQAPAASIDSAIVDIDPGRTTLATATIAITNFVAGQDVLGFVAIAATMGNIAISSNSNGVLTLSSSGRSATLAQWQVALRAVTYSNTSSSASTVTRNVTFAVDDGQASNHASNVLSTSITVFATNTPPLLFDLEATPLNYKARDTAMVVTSNLAVSDNDTMTLVGATIQITSGYQSGADKLLFTNTTTISGSFDTASGKLTLAGVDSLSNYRTAMRSIQFVNSNLTAIAGMRTISFQVNDGFATRNLSNIVSRGIAVTNGATPVVAGIPTMALVFSKNDPATAIAPALTVSDADSVNLSGAMIQITGSFTSGKDQLTFVNSASVTASFDAATGILSLSGTKPLAAYQTMLRTVAFQNSLNSFSTPTRTVQFTVTDETGNVSTPMIRTIGLSDASYPPALRDLETSPLIYRGGDSAVPLTNSIAVTDPDSNFLTAASAWISTNYQNGQDVLSFVNTSTLTGSWNATTGTLTITGVDTVSNYRTALRNVLFQNPNATPSLLLRTVSFQVSDLSSGTLGSNIVTRKVSPTGNAPSILRDIESTPLSYKASDPATPVTATVAVTDPDSDYLTSASIRITTNYQSNQDLLSLITTASLAATWNAATGTLTITGVDSVSNYRTALRNVMYRNSSLTPSLLPRTVSFQVSDLYSAVADSNVVTRNITLTSGASPILAGVPATPLAYSKNDAATVIAPAITVADADSTNLSGATIQIIGSYLTGQDQLSFVNSASVTSSFDAVSGTLTLTGTKSLSAYQAMLQSVTFQNLQNSYSTPTRLIQFVAIDDSGNSGSPVKRMVSLSDAAFPPVLRDLETTALGYKTGDPATPLTATLAVTDPVSNFLTSATIRISANYQNGQDVLNFANTATLSSTWNAATGTLTITGVDTVSNYRSALRNAMYRNTSASPSLLPRTVSFQVSDLSSAIPDSNIVTRTLTIS